jgi:hypothetical protein
MIEQFRRFLSSPAGKVVAVAVTLGLLGVAIYSAKAFFRGDTPDAAFTKMYIDTDTGKPFPHEPQIGETTPILAPGGKNTGMPAEACYWTKDGQIKTEPTWVLLNSEVGKPEPTFCPDCGRIVVGHNPQPVPGRSAPPTREQWLASRGGGN